MPSRFSPVLAVSLMVGLVSWPALARSEGGVTVTPSPNGQSLTIIGDQADNVLNVFVADGLLYVEGVANTTVIGGPLPLAGVRRIDIRMRGGADDVAVFDTPIRDFRVRIDMGPGADALSVENLEVAALTVRGTRGNDRAFLGGVRVGYRSTIDGGPGKGDAFVLTGEVRGPIAITDFEHFTSEPAP